MPASPHLVALFLEAIQIQRQHFVNVLRVFPPVMWLAPVLRSATCTLCDPISPDDLTFRPRHLCSLRLNPHPGQALDAVLTTWSLRWTDVFITFSPAAPDGQPSFLAAAMVGLTHADIAPMARAMLEPLRVVTLPVSTWEEVALARIFHQPPRVWVRLIHANLGLLRLGELGSQFIHLALLALLVLCLEGNFTTPPPDLFPRFGLHCRRSHPSSFSYLALGLSE